MSNAVQGADTPVEQRQSNSPRSRRVSRHLDSIVVLFHGLHGIDNGFRAYLDGHTVLFRWSRALPRCCAGMVWVAKSANAIASR